MADLFGALTTLTGITPDILDSVGRLYVMITDEDGGNYSAAFYSHISCETDFLVGHIATYSSTGLKDIVEDNDSGLGGQLEVVTVGNTDDESAVVAEFFRWGQIITYDTSKGHTLGIRGPNISIGAGQVPYLWIGQPNRLDQIQPRLPGSYGMANSSTAIWDVAASVQPWLIGFARVVGFAHCAGGVNGEVYGPPRINVMLDSVEVSTENSGEGPQVETPEGTLAWADGPLDPAALRISQDSTIEIKVTLQGAAKADDTNLGVYIVAVRE